MDNIESGSDELDSAWTRQYNMNKCIASIGNFTTQLAAHLPYGMSVEEINSIIKAEYGTRLISPRSLINDAKSLVGPLDIVGRSFPELNFDQKMSIAATIIAALEQARCEGRYLGRDYQELDSLGTLDEHGIVEPRLINTSVLSFFARHGLVLDSDTAIFSANEMDRDLFILRHVCRSRNPFQYLCISSHPLRNDQDECQNCVRRGVANTPNDHYATRIYWTDGGKMPLVTSVSTFIHHFAEEISKNGPANCEMVIRELVRRMNGLAFFTRSHYSDPERMVEDDAIIGRVFRWMEKSERMEVATAIVTALTYAADDFRFVSRHYEEQERLLGFPDTVLANPREVINEILRFLQYHGYQIASMYTNMTPDNPENYLRLYYNICTGANPGRYIEPT